MNRFRWTGLHEETGIWIAGSGVEYIEPKEYREEPRAYIINHGIRTEVKPETLLQTTCEHDCDGSEIFDTDIVEYRVMDGDEVVDVGYYQVWYNDCDGLVETTHLDGYYDKHIADKLYLCKVVGNKWDVPEFLKQAV